ncbi:hypothetical protein GALL_552900 [mine drainage metagenome]|uniref:Uncharacterized protein n=1 Tax=mine drainage metagenome TaxID=410659 RepID=A0A1J5NWN3_9ZZZZ
MTILRPASAAVSSTAAVSASQSSMANSGGKKTWINPSRASTARAVRTTLGSLRSTTGSSCCTRRKFSMLLPGPCGPRDRSACRVGSFSLGANGSGSTSNSACSGSTQGSDSSGRRRPTGLSPGIRNISPALKNHLPDCQRRVPPSITRRSGSTLPTTLDRPWA